MNESRAEVDRAIALAGGPTRMAEALGESVQVVTNWRKRGIPAYHCQAVALLTRMGLRELRPEDWARYWPDAPSMSKRGGNSARPFPSVGSKTGARQSAGASLAARNAGKP